MLQRTATSSIITVLFLTGCAGQCPSIKSYSIPEQKIIARERNALSDNDPLKSFIDEGESLRRYCR